MSRTREPIPEKAMAIILANLSDGLTLADIQHGKKGVRPEVYDLRMRVGARIALALWDARFSYEAVGKILEKHHTTIGLWIKRQREALRAK